jgi:hypothetical protein
MEAILSADILRTLSLPATKANSQVTKKADLPELSLSFWQLGHSFKNPWLSVLPEQEWFQK